jgi:hypothetical protein
VYAQAAAVVAPPTNVVATATAANRVTVTWGAVAGATQYRVYRRDTVSGSPTLLATVSTTSYTDTTAAAGRTYLYTVLAVNSSGTPSADSAMDHATTIMFTDDPLVSGVTIINAMRAAAGLPAATWTDPSPAGVRVKAVHIMELRNALAPALTAFGKTAAYTDPTLTAGMPIRAIHFQQLRNVTK